MEFMILTNTFGDGMVIGGFLVIIYLIFFIYALKIQNDTLGGNNKRLTLFLKNNKGFHQSVVALIVFTFSNNIFGMMWGLSIISSFYGFVFLVLLLNIVISKEVEK